MNRVEPSPSGAAVEADPPERVLTVVEVSKTFARPRKRHEADLNVLDRVSFTADRGEFVTLIGPSGCGKSTLLKCVAGLEEPDTGVIRVGGRAVDGPGLERAVVFQHATLLPWRTVLENVSYALELGRGFGKVEVRERALAAIAMVGLEPFRDHYPHEISGGMQQRVNLARALSSEPELILMDEPFGALDAITREGMQNELGGLIERIGTTVVFITHDIEEAILLSDKVITMSAGPGRIAASTAIDFERPRHRDVLASRRFQELVAEHRALLHP